MHISNPENIFEHCVSAIVILDMDRKITFFNRSVATLLGLNATRIKLNHPLSEFVLIQDEENIFKNLKEKEYQDQLGNMEVNFEVLKTRRACRVLLNIVKMKEEGNSSGYFLDMIDLSLENKMHENAKRREQELEKLNHNLELLVDERSNQLKLERDRVRTLLNNMRQSVFTIDKKRVFPKC